VRTTVLLLSVFLAACLVVYATGFSSKLAESHISLVTSAPAVQDPRTSGDVVVRGSLQAGDGDVANGGSVLVKAGDGKNGASGGNVLVGPGTHAAEASGTTGKGGDLRIEAGSAKWTVSLKAGLYTYNRRAGDGCQRPLRSRFQPRLKRSVDMTSDVKSRLLIFSHCLRPIVFRPSAEAEPVRDDG
jgi:hypothetical protein